MKKYLTSILFFLMMFHLKAQIFTQNPTNGSITITPKGLKGNSNSSILDTSSVALGYASLQNNSDGGGPDSRFRGIANTAIGYAALRNNASACCNTAVGWSALYFNTLGYENCAIGEASLYSNTTGTYNTAIGSGLIYNTSGSNNTSLGFATLYQNTTGSYNTGSGYEVLANNTIGYHNTAYGNHAGLSNVAGSYNTFLGDSTDASAGNFSNATAIGYLAIVNASNKVRIGNSNVTTIEGQVAWSYPSDRRLKERIVYTNKLGLDFISKLQTVSYNYINDKGKNRYDGFIAQDVEAVMKQLGVQFSGLKKSENGMYSLAYSDFVMPLVNAVQELKDKNKELEKRVAVLEELKIEIENLKVSLRTENKQQLSGSKR